ncbi:hypothetical protein CR513_01497, partial [Mucuna pruriens]
MLMQPLPNNNKTVVWTYIDDSRVLANVLKTTILEEEDEIKIMIMHGGRMVNHCTAPSDVPSGDEQNILSQKENLEAPSLFFIPNDQHKALLELLQDSQYRSTTLIITYVWILGTWATDHFQSFRKIKPIQVKLPDNTHVVATVSGTVKFSDTLLLTVVLYIPTFNFNLISVSELSSSLNYTLTFIEFDLSNSGIEHP